MAVQTIVKTVNKVVVAPTPISVVDTTVGKPESQNSLYRADAPLQSAS
jgi:hypothetical protein